MSKFYWLLAIVYWCAIVFVFSNVIFVVWR